MIDKIVYSAGSYKRRILDPKQSRRSFENLGWSERTRHSLVSRIVLKGNRSDPQALFDIGATKEDSATAQVKDSGLDISETVDKDPGFLRNGGRPAGRPPDLSQ